MRLLVDLPPEHVELLDNRAKRDGVSRASIIRDLVAASVEADEAARRRAAIEAGFGLWKDRGIDGLAYQEAIRAEWDRDPGA